MPQFTIKRTMTCVAALCCGLGATALGQTTVNGTPGGGAPTAKTPSGRAPSDKPEQQQTRPVTNNVPAEAGMLMQKTGGSLFRATLAVPPDPNQAKITQVSYFAVPEPEPRTIKKHDLVTVVIREESAIASQSTTDFKRESTMDAAIEEFIKLKLSNFEFQGGAQGINPPSIKAHGNREFKGLGDVERTDSLTARITAEVLDVKPNGTLVVQARKQIKTDEEEQQFILSGICRVEDISADNTILSTQLFDLRLQKNHKGAVRDATKRGWFVKLLDAVAPF